MVTLHWVTARSVHLLVVQFTEALKIQLVQRIETALANIKAAKNEQLLLKDEARVVTASIWLLSHQAKLNPVPNEFTGSNVLC